MQVCRHCTAVPLAAFLAVAVPHLDSAASQQPPAPATPAVGEATFVVFVSGREVGREQVSLSRTASGWTITSKGKIVAPLNFTNNHFQITYAPDWQPIELRFDGRQQDRSFTLATSFGTTTAINEITQNSVTNTKTDQITVRTVVIPNNFYAAYEALAVRLAQTAEGTEIPVYVAPQGEIRLLVSAVTPTVYETPSGSVSTRRYSVVFQNPGTPLTAEVTIDGRNRLAKIELGDGTLTVARQDLAGVATREHSFRNPTDADVRIPAAGFSLAGTLTMPGAQGRLRHPAIVLVAGSGTTDRDGTFMGIPLLAQLAGQLADRGFAVLRYDKRGTGQSGGRIETVTLRDYADDAVAAVKWIARHKEVDDKRVLVIGHSEGAAITLLAAREKRVAALVLMAAMGTTGRELVLEQQRYVLDAAKVAEPDRAKRIELQQKILEAAVAETGWEGVPADVRPIVDTPLYRSIVLFDPAQIMKDIKQPILVLHGSLDTEVPPHHAERLAELARARKKAPPVEMKLLEGVNHVFVQASTGQVAEYAKLESRTISPAVAQNVEAWVKDLPAR